MSKATPEYIGYLKNQVKEYENLVPKINNNETIKKTTTKAQKGN